MRQRDFVQDTAAFAVASRELAMTKGTVRHDRDRALLAPRNDGVLNGALAQMVEDLVTHHPARPRDGLGFFEIGNVEIADAPRPDLALAEKLLEGLERLLE